MYNSFIIHMMQQFDKGKGGNGGKGTEEAREDAKILPINL